ncbi:beta-ketoacyl reductase, partial [Streptomyces sp. NPDC045714]|uniref:beta-ketoacyl reductase n=1 Tax=Streptomyces sp. NPDC045714 TaxID=3154913 RepID=UPI00340D4CB0
TRTTDHTLIEVPTGNVHDVTEHILTTLQHHLTTDKNLIILTRNAVNTPTPDLAAAAVWGLVRTAQTEHPDRITLIDTDDTLDPTTLTGNEPQLTIRNGKTHAPRLTRTPTPQPITWDPDDTVLITGGTGTLGTILARHLIETHHIRNLILVSRRGQTPHTLTDLNANITTTACDTTNRQALHHLITNTPNLTAVIHTAGIVDDALLTTLTPEQLHTVLTTKTDTAHHLHELTQHLNLKAFVLYSSLAGTLGNPGQANYAAANAYLDALAQHRHTQGLPATSIAWGLWANTSGTTQHLTTTDHARLTRDGITPITTEHGNALFDAALGLNTPTTIATPLNLTTISKNPTIPPLLRNLIPRHTTTT